VNLENVTRDDWIVGGLALLLAIALLFFPWFDISVTVGAFSASATYSATSTPDGWLGILAMLAALAVVADLAVERLSPQTQIPTIGGSRTSTRFILSAIALGLIVLKFLFHIHFDLFGWGFYLSVVIAVALLYFAAAARSAASAGPSAPSRPASPSPPAGGTGGSTRRPRP
jgi:hypothetical protein